MKEQLIKILKGAVIAGLGALLTYASEALAKVDFGSLTPAVVAAFSVLVNIIRKLLVGWSAAMTAKKVKVLVFCVLAAGATGANAQNLATNFSHGPSIPFYTISWDKSGEMTSDFLNAGAGYSFNWNFKPDASGQVMYVNIGMPIFFNVAGNGDAPATTRFYAGLTLGTFNNILAFGPALKLMEAQEGSSPTGVFESGLKKENVALLFSFNVNFGTGKQATLSRRAGAVLVAPDKAGPPPNYYRPW